MISLPLVLNKLKLHQFEFELDLHDNLFPPFYLFPNIVLYRGFNKLQTEKLLSRSLTVLFLHDLYAVSLLALVNVASVD